ncbi:MAG: hypothetical protein EBQ57_03865 [Actinobacteria bacterium]|nr:hypothetical protein [Actinomycetota bacterium]
MLNFRKWFDRMQPQTLQIATWLLYINGFFALADLLDGGGVLSYFRYRYTFGFVWSDCGSRPCSGALSDGQRTTRRMATVGGCGCRTHGVELRRLQPNRSFVAASHHRLEPHFLRFRRGGVGVASA